MISKELLSNVLNVEVQEVDFDFISKSFSESVIRYYSDGKDYLINIYELAHKCKEWAFKLGYILESAYVPRGRFTSSYCLIRIPLGKDNRNIHHEDTEPEAIFKACQWILDNKEQK